MVVGQRNSGVGVGSGCVGKEEGGGVVSRWARLRSG